MKEVKNFFCNLDVFYNLELLFSENFEDLMCLIDILFFGIELNLFIFKLDVDMICQYVDIILLIFSFVLNEFNIVKVDLKYFEEKIILDMVCSLNCEIVYVLEEGINKILEININGKVVENFFIDCSLFYMIFCFDGVIYVNFEKKFVYVNILKNFDKVYNFICKDDKEGVWFLRGIIFSVNNELIVCFKLWKER